MSSFSLLIIIIAFVCRNTNFSSHASLFQRQGPFWLIWPSLYLKPPRLMTIRTEMMPKNQKRILVRRHRFLLCSLKTLAWTRRGNESTSLLLRVPLCDK
jgi:hypothetical protein